MFLVEATWWAHRALWQLIYAGVLERHPTLQFVFTEQGTAWLPEQLATLDAYRDRMADAVGSQENVFGGAVMGRLSLTPSEYWARQCHVGRELHPPPRGRACATRSASTRSCGATTSPIARGAGRSAPSTCAWPSPACRADEVAQMVGGNAAELYGFDLDALAPAGGPRRAADRRRRPPARLERHPGRGAAVPGLRPRLPPVADPSTDVGDPDGTHPLRRSHSASSSPTARSRPPRSAPGPRPGRQSTRPTRGDRGGAAAADRAGGRAARQGHGGDRRPGPTRRAAVRRRLVLGARPATRAPTAATRWSCP